MSIYRNSKTTDINKFHTYIAEKAVGVMKDHTLISWKRIRRMS